MKNSKKYIIPTILISAFLLGISASYTASYSLASTSTTTSTDKLTLNAKEAQTLDALKSQIPKTLQDAEARILPIRTRYLMYTYDGTHIMWGSFGRSFFTGTDNEGKHAWGIYGNGIFAGFYDNNFFWGKYSNGNWKAEGLFDSKYTSGRYVTFPILLPAVAESIPVPQ